MKTNPPIKKWFTCIGLIVIFLFACKKKDDTPAPVVTIQSPSPNSGFTVGDTVLVKATISTHTTVSSASVRLLNTDYVSAGSNVTANNANTNSVITVQYILDNMSLATGNYFLTVTVSDGNNVTNSFVNIQIQELPKVRKGIYLLSSSNNFSFLVSKVDSLHHVASAFTVNGDYTASAVYSGNHELFTLGKTQGAFNAFDLNSNGLLWSKPATSAVFPTFMNLFLSDDVVYVSYYDGSIRGFSSSGNQTYSIPQGYFIPNVLCKNDSYFFSELYYPTFHQNKLGTFYLISGAEKQECILDIFLKNIFSQDNNHLLFFGNDTTTGNGKIEIHDVNGNGNTVLQTINAGIIYNVAQVDNDRYFIAYTHGIYLYDYALNSLAPYVSGLPVYSIEYDDLDQELFACSGNSIHVYNTYTGAMEYTISIPDSARDVKVLYNK